MTDKQTDALREAMQKLLKAGNALAFAAETTGGTAGPDLGLQAAISEWQKAKARVRIERFEPPGTVVGAVGGAALAQPAPERKVYRAVEASKAVAEHDLRLLREVAERRKPAPEPVASEPALTFRDRAALALWLQFHEHGDYASDEETAAAAYTAADALCAVREAGK